MLRGNLRLALAFGLVLLVGNLAAPVARGDDFTITSGDLHFDTGDPPYFTFNGNGLVASGVVLGGQWHGYPEGLALCGGNCPAGTTTNLSTAFGRAGALAFGSATINGVTWQNPSGPDVWYSGTLQFDAPGTVVLDGGAGVTSYLSPFTFAGRLQGFARPDVSGPPLFDVSLHGQGDATLRMFFDPGSERYRFTAMSYTFRDNATAVTPEPGSLMLLGSGVAAALALGRRSRRRLRGR